MSSKELYLRLKEAIDNIQVVDAHEHHPLPEEDYLKLGTDFTRFFSMYSLDDLETAGMELPDREEFYESYGQVLRVGGKKLSIKEKWEHIKPHWENCRYTGYSRGLLHSLKKHCGVDDLNDNTYELISERLTEMQKSGVYKKILKGDCNFKYILNDMDKMAAPGAFERMDNSIFHFVGRYWNFFHAFQKPELEILEKKFNRSIRSLDDILDTLDQQFELWKQEGRVALKSSDAYQREIYFEDVTRDEAERAICRVFTFNEEPSLREARPYQDYLTHRIMDRAQAYGLPMIYHTGFQCHGVNYVNHSRATHLTNLLIKYPKLKFHLYHINYPWTSEAASIAKQFPNVTLDLTWIHIIVPEGAREGLSHILDMVPVNKIHGFGGDFKLPESVWGALEVARENIARVLADKVEMRYMTETQAVAVANKILAENAQKIFDFEGSQT